MEYFSDIDNCNRYVHLYYKRSYIHEWEYTKYQIRCTECTIWNRWTLKTDIITECIMSFRLGQKLHSRRGPSYIKKTYRAGSITIVKHYNIYGKEYDYSRWLKYLHVTTKYSNKR